MTGDSALPATSLSVRLREQTRESHERIESSLNLLQPGIRVEQYIHLLERWHGFERTWEQVAPQRLGQHAGDDFLAARRRLPMLRNDLIFLGRTDTQLAALPVVQRDALPWQSPSGALGVLYVIEGSTLGGQHVAKFIREHLGLTPKNGVAYFSSYGTEIGKRWRETKALLDAPPFVVNAEETIAAAIATFNFLGNWLVSSPLNHDSVSV